MKGIVLLLVLALGLGIFVSACSDDDNGGTGIQPDNGNGVGQPDVLPPELPPQDTDGAQTTSCAPTEAVSWNAARDHVGTDTTIIGPVYDVQDSDDNTVTVTIGSDQVSEEDRLNVVLTQNALGDLTGDATDLFQDSEVCVRGVIQEPPGEDALEMIVNQGSQIQRL